MALHRSCRLALGLAALVVAQVGAGQTPLAVTDADASEPMQVGPFLAHVIEGGPALRKPLPAHFSNSSGWTEWAWVNTDADTTGDTLIAGEGDPRDASRFLMLRDGRPGIRLSGEKYLFAPQALGRGWHVIAASGQDGHVRLYLDGAESQTGDVSASVIDGDILLAPVARPEDSWTHFSGRLAFSAVARAFDEDEMRELAIQPAWLETALYEENSRSWSLQTKQQAGNLAPQGPDLMPTGADADQPHAAPMPPPGPTLKQVSPFGWEIAGNWRLLSNDRRGASLLPGDGARISTAGFADKDWLAATVPGTVLTTLIDRGIYPDPYVGLNNLAIPESLNRHDYWYRVSFPTPRIAGGRLILQFAGINYSADVWVNGKQVGTIRGAFRRGDFDITSLVRAGSENVIAVRVSPPPHPGIPHEESIAGGPGENGGSMLIDGPTFSATEGWDWIPSIRDRDTGLWQGASLVVTGAVRLGDLQIITHLPLPDTSTADVELHIPLHNSGHAAERVVLTAEFEGVRLRVPFTAPAGDSIVDLVPARYGQLHLQHPRLWWPNGYGAPELYHLKVGVEEAGAGQHREERSLTFGAREVTYELSLFDHAGKLERVEVLPTSAALLGFDPVDVRHEAMRQTATGWASSLTAQAEGSVAVRTVTTEPRMTDLVIKVNGVRIAVRGGNWGMDDARKRVERDRLEPYFRLHKEANLNIIRNWMGQNTEESFYQLADEYGMMVWNDFWASTQNYNAEPGDPELFLDNARDTVRRYRNHPSIVLWCGRNEGVPPPVLNEGLIKVLHEEDGTRFYSPSSNNINLRGSGPYGWEAPALYFSKLNRGFAVELGISSFPTREAFEHTVAKADLWPMSDAWAYHDWHQSRGGDTHELMRHVDLQFGPSRSLAEFERKQQMFNYVDHQAIFEGMYQHLWSPNSGRLIWMSHPAWPSTMWQMYSSDYDTQASFYAIRKANAPIHVQMDLSDGTVIGVNSSLAAQTGTTVTASVYTVSNQLLHTMSAAVALPANDIARAFQLPLDVLFTKAPLLLIRLDLKDAKGKVLANNFYWITRRESDTAALTSMPEVSLQASAREVSSPIKGEKSLEVRLANPSESPALMTKLTVLDEHGERILPAYYGDNYISLLAGESAAVTIQLPSGALKGGKMRVAIRGWNIKETTIELAP